MTPVQRAPLAEKLDSGNTTSPTGIPKRLSFRENDENASPNQQPPNTPGTAEKLSIAASPLSTPLAPVVSSMSAPEPPAFDYKADNHVKVWCLFQAGTV